MRSLGASGGAPILSVASASTTDIGAARGDTLSISGTTGITSFGTAPVGTARWLTFQGVLTITYNATSMILPGLASITTVGGDTALFVSLGGGNWRCLDYMRVAAMPALSIDNRLSSCWVNFNGNGTVAIRGASGIASVTRNGVGDYTVTFLTSMVDTNYTVGVTLGELEGNAFTYGRIPTGKGTASFRFRCIQVGGSYADVSQVDLTFFGGR